MGNETIRVIVKGEDELSAVFARAGTATTNLGKEATIASKGIDFMSVALGNLAADALGAAVDGVKDFVAGSIELASNAGETTSLLENSLGPATVQFSQDIGEMAEATNRSAIELEKGASTIVAMTKSMGFGQEAAGEFSASMAQIAVDLGSFFNQSTEQVFQDLQSALAGSAETMLKYGIDVKETALQNAAYEMGLISQGQTLDRVTRAQVLQAEILRQAADAMGDAERTSDSFSNTQRGLEAATLDLQAALGEELIPTMYEVVIASTDVVRGFNAMLTASELSDEIKLLSDDYKELQKAIQDVATEGNFLNVMESHRIEAKLNAEVLELLKAGVEGTAEELVGYAQAAIAADMRAKAMNDAFEDQLEVTNDLMPVYSQLAYGLKQVTIAELDATEAFEEFQETIDPRTFERLIALFGDEALALDYLRQVTHDAGQASDDYELSADQLGATISDTTIPALGDYYTETDRARGITRDARDEIDQLKADMLGIAGPAQEGASAFGRAAFEIWQDAQEAAGQVSDLNDELDDLTGFYEAEITTPGAQDAIDIIAILKGKAEETAGTYEIIYNVTVTGDEPPEGGGATGGGTGNLPAPEEPAFLHGGYTGATGGIVDPHEFVFSSPAVQAIGLENLEAMHRLAKTGQSAGSTINHFNMTVHTSASTSTVTQDFHLMQSLAGNH